MKTNGRKRTTEELLSLGMALHADRDTMEMRIRGIFSRERSMRIAAVSAVVLTMALAIACFTTACLPVTRSAAEAEKLPTASPEVIIADTAEEALLLAGVSEEEIGSLLHFDGYAEGDLVEDRITVTDGMGVEHAFTWVDEGIQERSEPIPEGTYASPAEVALRAAEIAVTVYGDAFTEEEREIHINMYKHADMELVYYGIGFGGTPFEGGNAFGYADAVTGTVLLLEANNWGHIEKKYGSDLINGKMEAWDWNNERYAAAHTSEKALATATELIHSCFATDEIIPPDPDVWDAGSHTDGEQIDWDGGYEAIVDAYIRLKVEPCYYVQVAVPLEEGAEPRITIFGCYPLGWEYCCNQIHDPAVLKQELAEMEAGVPAAADGTLSMYADRAEALQGTTFTPMADEWRQGDDPAEYQKIFLVRIGAYLDDGFEGSDPILDSAKVDAMAKRGNVLRFESNGQFYYAIYLGDGVMAYADAERMIVRNAYVADWLKDKEGKPDCTCCILTWH